MEESSRQTNRYRGKSLSEDQIKIGIGRRLYRWKRLRQQVF